MEERQIAWDDVVPGVYVWNTTTGWLRAIERHPYTAGRVRFADSGGDIHDLTQPLDRTVTAYVPDADEAAETIARFLHAGQAAKKMIVEPMPPRSPHRWINHLRIFHGVYMEPSMKVPELRAAHDSLHAQRTFAFPHVHREA